MKTVVHKKSGYTLIEVMISSVLIAIIAISFSGALAFAARLRMRAHLRGAAEIMANSCMEGVIATVDATQVPDGTSGFVDTDMKFQSSDPSTSSDWIFDGKGYRQLIEVANNDNILDFSVSIFCDPDNPVILKSQRYIEP